MAGILLRSGLVLIASERSYPAEIACLILSMQEYSTALMSVLESVLSETNEF